MQARYVLRDAGIASTEARDLATMKAALATADVLVVSGLWRTEMLAAAPNLRFIQSIGAGTDQFDRQALAARGISLASAAGVNARAVAEHAMALILAMARRLPEARDNQAKKHWRGMIGDISAREDELGGKTLLIVGMGRIGGGLARLGKAFDMQVIGVRANPAAGLNGADEMHATADVPGLLPRADFVALTCPLTPETTGLINAASFSAMHKGAYLINCARGRVVVEAALVAALQSKQIAGAAIDVVYEEPLDQASPLWTLPNAFVTPHTGGETRKYEDNVLDILLENLKRLRDGGSLVNQVVP
ncbi:MAG: D-2-hydroxyacid dehydrogenase [Acetobacteraceae bacterium]|nr:D-2-hydroxyacid dehydrogenase [Acetobacteraceae bacterium]